MGSYEDASGEHEESCRVDDSRSVSYSSVHVVLGDSMGDVQDDESLVMIWPEQLMVQLEGTLEHHSSPLQAYIDGARSTVGSPLAIRERETELPSQISCVDLDSGMR